jgi:uncharacterized lipoprotein YmbA
MMGLFQRTQSALARILVVAGCAALVSCASTPKSHYYSLNMTPAQALPGKYNLDVDRLRTAEALTKHNLLARKSPTQLEYYASHEWIAAIDEIVTEKLEAEFGADQEGKATIAISGDILAFQQEDTENGADAYIKLTIEFRPAVSSRYANALLERTYENKVKAQNAEPNAIVVALGGALEQIAAKIVADANALVIPDNSGQTK